MYGVSLLGSDPASWLIGTLGKALSTAGSTLLNGLVSYWPLNETSGVRYDVVGSNHLTDNNTVGSVSTGPVGVVAKFTSANLEYLNRNSFSWDAPPFSVIAWCKRTSDTAFGVAVGQFDSGGTNGSGLVFNGSDAHAFVRNGGSTVSATFAVPTLSDWHMFYYEVPLAVSGTVTLSVDNGTFATTNITPGNYTPISKFAVGLASGGGAYYDGQVSCVGIWSRVLTTNEKAALYNGGKGLKYADLPAGLLTGLVSYYNLDETSGTRNDSHGTNHLTDNNTVDCEYHGPLGVVASTVEANSEYLSSTSSDFTPVGSFSASLWVYITSPNICFFMGKEFTDPQPEWSILTGASGSLEGRFWGGGLTQARGPDTWGARSGNWSAPNLNRWWLLTYVYDATAHTVTMYLNDAAGTPASTGVRTLSELGGAFMLLGGARSVYGTNKAASAGFWTKALSGAEVVALFNNGAGLRYADLSAGLKTSLVSWWNLDEQSGVRYDSHGTNHLTDNNTVGSVINAGAAMDGAAASFVAANSESLSRASFNPGQEWTASYWCKLDASSAAAIVFEIQNIVYDYIGAGQIYFFGTGGTGTYSYAIPTIGEWQHHLVWSDGSKVYAQLNGGTVWEDTRVSATGANTLSIGQALPSYYTTGKVDEVAIWSRVLTADERTELWNAGRGKFYNFS